MIDLTDRGNGESPVEQFNTIEKELYSYGDSVVSKDRWLVLNKIDVVPSTEVQPKVNEICQQIDWKGPVYSISTITRAGLDDLCKDILQHLEQSAQHD